MPSKNITSFTVHAHTGDDNKDEDNGVTIRIYNTRTGVIYLDEIQNYGTGLTFHAGTDVWWDVAAKLPMPLSEAQDIGFWVEMNGDDGNWDAAFSLVGLAEEGIKLVLMEKTEERTFHSDDSDAYQFPLTYQALSARRLALAAKLNFAQAKAK